MRRVLAVLVGAGIAVGGGAAAWAGTAGADGPKREAAEACLTVARQAAPDAGKAALRDAVKACLKEARIDSKAPTPEQQARREAVRSCVQAAKAAHPDDKAAARALVGDCLEQAGVAPGRLRAKVSVAKECLAEARAARPGASKDKLRATVKECVASK
ncbi:MAG TPA: hypothetical protein VGV86_07420 [Acidimicrobiales bacterium]|nr:hypothetical protein [Acidimicrobiales bacterium]